MKVILTLFFAISISFSTLAQCDIPQPFDGNTGSNMTIMLTTDLISSLPISTEISYLVALNPVGLVVGSQIVSNISQTTIAIWGDDSTTGIMDGALPGESINFQLIDGDNIYDIEMPTSVNYSTNVMVPQISAATSTPFCIYGCTSSWAENFNPQATDDDGACFLNGCTDELACNYIENSTVDNGTSILPGCTNASYVEYYHQGYTAGCDDGSCSTETSDLGIDASYFSSPSNTRSNMTIGINLTNTVGLEGSKIAAFFDLNNDGLITECVGLSVFQEGFFSLSLWGNDASKSEIDGLLAGETDVIFAVLTTSGNIMVFNLFPEFTAYTTNALSIVTALDFNVTI